MKHNTSRLIAVFLSLAVSLNANAATDGSVTKTATEITSTCAGGGTRPCSGGGTRSVSNRLTCNCGATIATSTNVYCTSCGACVSCVVPTYNYTCSTCGVTMNGGGQNSSYPHGSVSYKCAHGYSSSHSIGTGTYKNAAYGYTGSSSTFKVWPCSVTYADGVTQKSYAITNQTATDYALPGNTVTIGFSAAPAGYQPRVTVNGGSEILLAADATSYSYTASSQSASIQIGLNALLSVTASPTALTLEKGQASTLTATATSSTATITYSSNNTNVATVSNAGAVKGISAGSATITVTATT